MWHASSFGYAERMKQLVLVRHAKSDWSDRLVTDHERPLNGRGRENAPMMAERFAASGIAIGSIVLSAAVRARTTASEFGAALSLEAELAESLCLAPSERLLACAIAEGEDSVLIVAHDPGITVLANELSAGGIQHMPTCAVAVFHWDADRTSPTDFPSEA